MSNLIRPLTNDDIDRIRLLLNQFPVANLYLRDLVDRQGIDYFGMHRWMGAFEHDMLVALNADIAAVNPNVPCKLSVPVGKPEACVAFGHFTAGKGGTERVMSLRDSSEAFWQGLGTPKPLINHQQHVMSIHEPSEGERLAIRPATKGMLAELIESTALMRLEDEGIDPRKHDYDLWHKTIEILIAQRRIWVATEQGELSFVIEIGTRCSKGTQIGSTYVPPKFRGQSIATRGMRSIVNHLLQDTQFVSLLVNEGNTPARKCYERVGFQYGPKYQLFGFTY